MSGKDKNSTPKIPYFDRPNFDRPNFDRPKPLIFIDDRKKTTKKKSMEEIIHHQFTNYKRTLTNGNSIKKIETILREYTKKDEEYTKKDDMISNLIKKLDESRNRNDAYAEKIFKLQERLHKLELKLANKQS